MHLHLFICFPDYGYDMHPLCNFLQVMTAKEFESLMNGPALIDRGKSLDLSSGQGDSSIPSPATSPRSFGTPVNHNLKKGMS